MHLVINKCVTTVKVSNFSGHYLRNRSTLDVGVLSYIGIVQHKEHSPEVWSIPPGTPCISACQSVTTLNFPASPNVTYVNKPNVSMFIQALSQEKICGSSSIFHVTLISNMSPLSVSVWQKCLDVRTGLLISP